MKAIILSRVSTKEQEEGHSIAAQRQRLLDHCTRKALEVVKIFDIVESSTKGERKEFMAMLDFAKSQGETIAIVADAVDRFQRSFKESVLIDDLIKKGLVELHFHREGMVISRNASSSDILRWDFSVIGAKAYTTNLSENVRRSLDFKRRNGEWGGKAPLGYLNVRDANNKSLLIPDPERAPLVRMLFEDYAKGTDSISGDLVEKARKWGLRNKTKKGGLLSASQIQHILNNPFYFGVMRVKGDLQPHRYEPIISQALFDRCQGVADGRTRATTAHYSEKPFVFRGLVKCAVSGRMVTSDIKKGRHTYLICRDPKDPARKLFVPEAEVLEQVKAVFRSIQVPKTLLETLLAHLKASHGAERQFHEDAIVGLQREHERTREKLATLLDLRLDQSITRDEYDKKARELKELQVELAMRIEEHQKGEDGFRTTLESLISVASQASRLFERSKTEQKRELIAFVFSNLQLRGKKLEFSLRSPFDLMVNRRSYEEWLGD